MFRSAIELELLAQAKIDDFNTECDRLSVARPSPHQTFLTRARRRFGLRLIDAGTRLVGPEMPPTVRPAIAGR
jgi:hypothetical protein